MACTCKRRRDGRGCQADAPSPKQTNVVECGTDLGKFLVCLRAPAVQAVVVQQHEEPRDLSRVRVQTDGEREYGCWWRAGMVEATAVNSMLRVGGACLVSVVLLGLEGGGELSPCIGKGATGGVSLTLRVRRSRPYRVLLFASCSERSRPYHLDNLAIVQPCGARKYLWRVSRAREQGYRCCLGWWRPTAR